MVVWQDPVWAFAMRDRLYSATTLTPKGVCPRDVGLTLKYTIRNAVTGITKKNKVWHVEYGRDSKRICGMKCVYSLLVNCMGRFSWYCNQGGHCWREISFVHSKYASV